MLELCEAWHHHMMHSVVKKQALDMQHWFKINEVGLYNTIKQVKKGCWVCQGCNPDNRNVRGEAQWTPIPDQPMESVARDVFSMPEVHIGKEIFNCVVLCTVVLKLTLRHKTDFTHRAAASAASAASVRSFRSFRRFYVSFLISLISYLV